MAKLVLSHARLRSSAGGDSATLTGLVLAGWFAVVFFFAAGDAFVTAGGAPPLAALTAAAAPIILFGAGLLGSHSLREFALATDLRLLTGIQAWRIGGFSFLALHTFGVLPGYFAWPAGLGDIAIGVSAPWIMVWLIRKPGFVTSRTFATWQVLGILDLVVAVSLGAFGWRIFEVEGPGAAATSSMTQLPLALVPAFFVPAFIISHIAALFRARQLSPSRNGKEAIAR